MGSRAGKPRASRRRLCCLPDGNTVQVTWWACAAAAGWSYPPYIGCVTRDCYSATGLAVNVHPSGTLGLPGLDTVATLDIPWNGGQLIDGGLSVAFDIETVWQGVYRARIVHPDGTTVQLIMLPGATPPKVAGPGNWGFSNQNFGGGGQMMSFVDNAPAGVYDSAAGYPGPPRATATGTSNVAGTWMPYSGTLSQFKRQADRRAMEADRQRRRERAVGVHQRLPRVHPAHVLLREPGSLHVTALPECGGLRGVSQHVRRG
jgi:hypothetical protein